MWFFYCKIYLQPWSFLEWKYPLHHRKEWGSRRRCRNPYLCLKEWHVICVCVQGRLQENWHCFRFEALHVRVIHVTHVRVTCVGNSLCNTEKEILLLVSLFAFTYVWFSYRDKHCTVHGSALNLSILFIQFSESFHLNSVIANTSKLRIHENTCTCMCIFIQCSVCTLWAVYYRKCMFSETYNVCIEEKSVNSSVKHWTQNKTDNVMSESRLICFLFFQFDK